MPWKHLAEGAAEAEQSLVAEQEQRVQREIERLAVCAGDYAALHRASTAKRLAWWDAHHTALDLTGSLPRRAYTLVFLIYMGLDPDQVPVVYEDEGRIVWRSANFCPTLEACCRLGLDTREVCRAGTEQSVEVLIRRLDGRLRFGRNYETGIRPYAGYCEEQIWVEQTEDAATLRA
jgi:tRNA(adenine34) deaminase